jgi:hypothetical protein
MKQNFNRGLSTKKKGPVWNAKVSVFFPVSQGTLLKLEKKLWEIKEILN